MIIYLEGVDGTGKSTLADALAKRLEDLKPVKGFSVVRDGELLIRTRPGSRKLNQEQLIEKLSDMAISGDTIYICDRGPLSDIIYRTFDDESPVLPLDNFWFIWLAHQMFIVTVFCDSDKAQELMVARGDDNATAINRHKELRYLYQQIAPMFNMIPYDVAKHGHDLQEVVNVILAHLWQRVTLINSQHKEERTETQ